MVFHSSTIAMMHGPINITAIYPLSVLREEHILRHTSDVITPDNVPISDVTARVAQDMLGHTW